MSNSETEKVTNGDFLSQSYSQGIERITGTKDHIVNFQVPKEVLENRKKTWDNLFDKYSEKMSDDVELNIKTLEPEETEEEKLSEEEHSHEQRMPMRKPATLVQYWINTGNTPYKVFLDKELSESGSSISEEEITSPSFSLLSNKVNESSKHKRESDTSFSSVDTAAYILSNANVTKKADTIAIIEGAKSNGVKSSEDDCIEGAKAIVCNDRSNCIETVAADYLVQNGNSDDVSHNDISQSSSVENVASDTNNELVTGTVISVNTVQPDVSSQNSSCDMIGKTDVLNASQKNVDLHNIVTIFKQFNEVTKRMSVDDKSNSTSDEGKTLKEHSVSKEQISTDIAEETVRKDVSLSIQRKKLYTGRNSPVDLILMEKDNSDVIKSKSPNARLNSHPALDPDNSFRSESLVHKDKRYLSNKKSSVSSKKVQGKKSQKRSSKNTTGDETVVNSSSTPDSTVDSSLQNLSSSPASNDNLIRDTNDTELMKMKNVTKKYPVIHLERITFPKRKKSESVKHKDNTQENGMRNDRVALKPPCAVENLISADSDQSTILMYECKNITSSDSSSASDSFHLRLSNGDECFVENAEEKNSKLTNLENADNQNKKPFVTLERLSQSIIDEYTKTARVLNMSGDLPISSEKLQNKPKMDSSTSREANVKSDVKLCEMKVVLERLPADTYFKRGNDAGSISSSAAKKSMSSKVVLERLPADTYLKRGSDARSISSSAAKKSMSSNKRKFKDVISSSSSEDKKTARTSHKINKDYSLRIHTRSEINDDETNDTSDDVAQHDNQISTRTGYKFTSRYRNHDSQAPQNKRRKFAVLDFISSDEDDLIRLIRPKKGPKTLIDKTSKTHVAEKDLDDEAILVSTSKDKYDSNRNISTTIFSSKQDNSRKIIDRSIKERSRRNGTVVKSSDSNATLNDSLSMYKHKKFSFFLRNNQCDSTVKNLTGRLERYPFSNTENISDNSERHPNKATKENKISRRNNPCVMLFQTKTFNIESSDSDRSSNDITSTRKSLRNASAHGTTRFNGHATKVELCNGFHAKMHADKQSNSLNSSAKKYNTANKTHNVRKRLRLATETNDQLDNEVNNNINLSPNITTKAMFYLPVSRNTRNALMKENNVISNASLRNNGPSKFLRNRQISEKPDLKNSQANRLRDAKLTVNRLLTFQTKSYYDSDSSGYW